MKNLVILDDRSNDITRLHVFNRVVSVGIRVAGKSVIVEFFDDNDEDSTCELSIILDPLEGYCGRYIDDYNREEQADIIAEIRGIVSTSLARFIQKESNRREDAFGSGEDEYDNFFYIDYYMDEWRDNYTYLLHEHNTRNDKTNNNPL